MTAVAHPSRVLVTGAAGRIGTAVTDLLVSEGFAVTALSIDYASPSAADRVIVGDVTVESDVAGALDGVDAVVHLAAMPHRDAGAPYDVFGTNVRGTFNVLAQAGQRGIRRAVVASSINAFGVPMNHHEVMPAYFPIDEAIPADIDDWYSHSKRTDESTAAMAWRHWGIDSVAIRFPLVDTAARLTQQVSALRGDPLAAVREGWAYLDLRDAARAVLAGLTARFSGAHVVGLSAADTLLELPTAEAVARFAPGVPVRRALTGRVPLVDASAAEQLLGFLPLHSAHESPIARERSRAEQHEDARV